MSDTSETKDVKVLRIPEYVLDRLRQDSSQNGAGDSDSDICRYAMVQRYLQLMEREKEPLVATDSAV